MRKLHADGSLSLAPSRALDFLSLGKPELTLLSVLTSVGAAYIAHPGGSSYLPLLWTFAGTLLVGLGAGSLNMLMERNHDAVMSRTKYRPLPSGRVTVAEAGAFGVLCSVGGVLILGLCTTPLAMLLAILTLVTYLMLYTPLKRLTPFATVVGGIPGALPPVIGWAAIRGTIGLEGWGLFAILFFWQMPHFLSLSWIYRNDYERAGYRLLSVLNPDGTVIRRQILVYTAALIPASVLPGYLGMCGTFYFAGALVLSVAMLAVTIRTVFPLTGNSARRLFFTSLAYLPLLMFLMIIDRIP